MHQKRNHQETMIILAPAMFLAKELISTDKTLLSDIMSWPLKKKIRKDKAIFVHLRLTDQNNSPNMNMMKRRDISLQG